MAERREDYISLTPILHEIRNSLVQSDGNGGVQSKIAVLESSFKLQWKNHEKQQEEIKDTLRELGEKFLQHRRDVSMEIRVTMGLVASIMTAIGFVVGRWI